MLPLNICHKKLLNICQENGPWIVPSFAMPYRLPGVPIILNHRSTCVGIPPQKHPHWFYYKKKDFPTNFR